MINEHDIADMMDQAYQAMPEEKKKVEFKTEGDEGIIDFEKFLLGYTEALYGIFAATWGINKKTAENDSGGKA